MDFTKALELKLAHPEWDFLTCICIAKETEWKPNYGGNLSCIKNYVGW